MILNAFSLYISFQQLMSTNKYLKQYPAVTHSIADVNRLNILITYPLVN